MTPSIRSLVLGAGLAGAVLAHPVTAEPLFELARLRGSVLDKARSESMGVAGIAPAPGSGILFTEWKSGVAYRIADPEKGKPQRLEGVAPPVFSMAGGDRAAFFSGPNNGSTIVDASGNVMHRFDEHALQPVGGAIVAGTRLFGAGVVRAGGVGDRSGELMKKCPVFIVDLAAATPRIEATGCDEASFDLATLSVYFGGHFRIDGDKVYGIWDATPDLFVFSRSGRLLRTIRLYPSNDGPPPVTMADRQKILGARDGYYRHRTTYRWAQGTLRTGDGNIAVVFREPASRGSGFTMDVYTPNGDRIASSVPLDLSLKSGLAVARPVSLSDGSQYILVHEPDETFLDAGRQQFYRVLPAAKAPAKKNP